MHLIPCKIRVIKQVTRIRLEMATKAKDIDDNETGYTFLSQDKPSSVL
jgi:hypothetical protein